MAKTTDFTYFANERPNYFPGQYLLEDDFELQHKYLSDRLLYHNQSLHLSGIIEGLEVTADQKSVLIKSGSAINSKGELIVLKKDISFSDFKNIPNGELYIQYDQKPNNQQQKDIADSYTRWSENPIVGFAATTPENSVKLAKLTISATGITVDNNIREYSGLSLPNPNSKALTLRSAGNANPNLAILTGSLKIEGDLTVNGTISGTIDTKNITSGILSVERIPNLSADKITSGTIAGSLTVNGNITGQNLSLAAADNSKRGTLFLAKAEDYNHALYNNYSNIDGEGAWDGAKWNVYNGLNIRVGGANNAKKTTALSIDANGNVDISNLTVNKIAIGDKPVEGDTGGNRKWMKTGIKISSNTDNLFIGLKNEGSNRNDAVIAWGDDTDDDLRFINVQAKDLTEKEVLRIKANGEIQGKIWYSDEYLWTNGQAYIKMGHSSKCVAFLTFVQGKFAGVGEQVFTTIGSDGFWYLGGTQGSGGAGIVAKARCIGSPN